MKQIIKSRSTYWVAIAVAFFMALAVVRAPVDPQTTAAPTTATSPLVMPVAPAPATPVPASQPERTYTGLVSSVDSKEHVFTVKGRMSSKTFNFGDTCAFAFLYTMLKNNEGPANDLRLGEKVTVHYEEVRGVLVAGHVEQQPMELSGVIKKIDPANHTLILRHGVFDKQLDISPDCIIMVDRDKPGALADIQPADHVIVNYEIPDGRLTAWQVTKTNMMSAAR